MLTKAVKNVDIHQILIEKYCNLAPSLKQISNLLSCQKAKLEKSGHGGG